QWESAQERKTAEQIRATTSRPSKASRTESGSGATAKRSGLSYREQKEWAKMEQRILQAEETIATCQAAVEDLAIASNATALKERSEALDAARTAAERLYARWTELEGKQTESASQPQT
ncbi:MAG: ABC transporter C-terminal domain-containing protein, partial [Nitrospirales bacterium]